MPASTEPRRAGEPMPIKSNQARTTTRCGAA